MEKYLKRTDNIKIISQKDKTVKISPKIKQKLNAHKNEILDQDQRYFPSNHSNNLIKIKQLNQQHN
jgi:hypothetical protein